jgi:hypothetical protein
LQLQHHPVITLGRRTRTDSLQSNKPAHEAECKSSGVKWPASTFLKRKTLISFGFAETLGTPVTATPIPIWKIEPERLETFILYGF